MENRIHLQINQQDQKAIDGALKVLEDKLGPHLKTLDAKERRSLPKWRMVPCHLWRRH